MPGRRRRSSAEDRKGVIAANLRRREAVARQILVRGLVACFLATPIGLLRFASAADPASADPPAMPDKYVLNYPAAQQFCPPVQSYFYDVTPPIPQIC